MSPTDASWPGYVAPEKSEVDVALERLVTFYSDFAQELSDLDNVRKLLGLAH